MGIAASIMSTNPSVKACETEGVEVRCNCSVIALQHEDILCSVLWTEGLPVEMTAGERKFVDLLLEYQNCATELSTAFVIM